MPSRPTVGPPTSRIVLSESARLSAGSFAEVALDVPLRAGDRVFTFAISPELIDTIQIGLPVQVPFGRGVRTGFVVGISSSTTRQVKSVLAVDARVPALPSELVSLAWWMADYYVCSVGEAIGAMLPSLAERSVKHRTSSQQARIHGSIAQSLPPQGNGTALRPYLIGRTPARIVAVGGAPRVSAYAEAAQWAVRRNAGILVVAPEIAQAEQLAGWMRQWVRQPLVLVHGGLSSQERWELWHRVEIGDVRVVVGTRVAIFSPVRDLGLIIIDREDDSSHKEERAPHYDARRIAEERALRAGAALLWGTLTPTVEMARVIEETRVVQVNIGARLRPRIALVDVRSKGKATELLSPVLQAAMTRTVPRGRVMLFVPRRGYADFLLCQECGLVPRCPQCDVAMTFHRRAATLRCHLCGRTDAAPSLCPRCGGTQLHPHGVGSEQVEAAARRLVKGTPVLRLDSDTAPTEEAQQRIWAAFASQGGVLVGTQLLTKGIGQVPAALVGALGVDGALHRPDFRAAERTYQVLTQLAALAQREMLIQTFAPSHPALRAIQQQDPRPFYRSQLAARERAGYPPYRTLINVTVSGTKDGIVRTTAEEVAAHLAGAGEVLGPAPSPQTHQRGQARWQLLIKESPRASIRPMMRDLHAALRIPRGVRLTIDVDPIELL